MPCAARGWLSACCAQSCLSASPVVPVRLRPATGHADCQLADRRMALLELPDAWDTCLLPEMSCVLLCHIVPHQLELGSPVV